jgi:hypothetical protein
MPLIRGNLSLSRGRIAVTARITCTLSPSGDSGGRVARLLFLFSLPVRDGAPKVLVA